LLAANSEMQPAAMVPTLMATEELTVLVAMGAAAIHEMLVQYSQRDKNEDKISLVNIPRTSVPIQSISVAGKSDEEVVAEVTQAVTTAIETKCNLPTVDRNKLGKQLCSQKLRFINTIADNRNWERVQHRLIEHRAAMGAMKSSNRAKGRVFRNQAVDEFTLANAIAHHLSNQAETRENFEKILRVFVDCNSPSYARRIEARIQLSEIAKCNPYVFGYHIKEAALNLQARYFDKNRLIDIFYDMRLPETIKMFLRESPYFWNNEKRLKELYDYVEKLNLDPENSFELMRQRGSGELTGEAKKRNYQKCKLQTLWFKGKIFPYPDKHKEILNESYNGKLFEVAVLCERGQLDEARAIAKRFNEDSMMKYVVNDYRGESFTGNLFAGLNEFLQKTKEKRLRAEAIVLPEAERNITAKSLPEDQISLAPDSDSSSTNQPIFNIVPPSLPPDQDPDKDKEQEKKKDSLPVLPEREKRIKKCHEEHNWGDRPGHVEKTPENIKLVKDVANDPECYLGPDKRGHHWYAKILEDGKQVWAKIRDNEIISWGINKPDNIKYYNPETGLAALKAPSQKIPRKPS